MVDTVFHDPAVAPGTHALVIGVGRYPHLIGGDSPATRTDQLRQLTSPPLSARAFARWLLTDYRWPASPLASLTLLVSQAEAHQEPTADIGTIVDAVKEWKRRGDTHAGNRMIFYFCGHGISEGNDMALLARDFSLDDDNPLDNALDFRNLVNGLRTCAAEQQLFFVDACRASSDVLISQSGGTFAGRVPLLGGGLPRREAITFYSTLAGDRSHARPNSVSLFTEAVLRALRGAGSDDPTGEWCVNTTRLHEAVDHFMKEPVFAGTVAGVQVPAVNAMPVFPIHQLADLPVVPVYVTCVPATDNGTAAFVCRHDGVETTRRDADDGIDPHGRWHLDLPAGRYQFEARVSADDVRVRSREIRPIFRSVDLGRTP